MDSRMRASASTKKRISPGRQRQRSISPAAGPSKRAKTTKNHNTEDDDGDGDGDSVIELQRTESKDEHEDIYALKDQRIAVKRENASDSLTCDFCKNLPFGPDGNPPCNRQIIDGWVFECTTCANHRAQSGNLDHKCFRTGQHLDLEVFKRYSDYHPVNFPQSITCEECKSNKKVKDSRCDADPYLQLRCTCCMKTKDTESKLCRVKATTTTGDADFGWRHGVERQMGPKPNLQKGRQRWFRRECDICKSKPDKSKGRDCSWLDSRDTGEPGDPRKPCRQCKEGNMSCFDSGMLVGHPDSLEVPTEWSTRGDLGGGWVELRGDKDVVTRSQCRQCHAHKRHCRASAKHAEYACNWCWQTGMVCQDLRDENKIYPLFDLSRVGIGNFCPFARCRRCEAMGRNCDRQRPCDSCFFNGEGDMCDTWHAGALSTLNCLNRRINDGENMLVKPGPLYYLSMGYGPTGVDDEKNGTQIEHYIGPPFARYAFKAVADKPGEVLKQNKQVVVAETQRMRTALTARGVPPNGAPGGELDGVNVNDITIDQLRTWMVKRWPNWTRQCDRKSYAKHRDFEIIAKAYMQSRYMETSRTGPEASALVEELEEGDEDLQIVPVTNSAFDISGGDNQTGNGIVASMVNTAPNVVSNAALMMLPPREGWWNDRPDLPSIPKTLFPGETRLSLTLFKPEICSVYQLFRWKDLLHESMPPSEQAIWQNYHQHPNGTSDFGLFSIMYGSLVRHSPINQVFRGISWNSTNVQLQDLPCTEQGESCRGLVQTACQDVEHNDPHRTVCDPCGVNGSGLLLIHDDRITKFDILTMRAYFCASCHSRLIGGPRSVSEMYLLGAKSVWGCQFANNTTLDGKMSVNGRRMGFYPFANPITGCTCGGNMFNSRLCLADRVKYARHAMYQADRMRDWRSRHDEVDLCPGCLIHKPKEKATASPSYREILVAEEMLMEETASWACLVCGELVLNQPKKSTIVGGWFNWFPPTTVSDWGLDQELSF